MWLAFNAHCGSPRDPYLPSWMQGILQIEDGAMEEKLAALAALMYCRVILLDCSDNCVARGCDIAKVEQVLRPFRVVLA
jgi:hypothetical protein